MNSPSHLLIGKGLINALIGQVESVQKQLSGKPTCQDFSYNFDGQSGWHGQTFVAAQVKASHASAGSAKLLPRRKA